MRWTIAQGYRQDNPAGDVVTAALPKRPARVLHRPALPHREPPGTPMHGSGTTLAFEFLVLTVARSKEVRLATWDEIDLVKLAWTVPAIRMKAHEEHKVPLCARAVEVLRELLTSDAGSSPIQSTASETVGQRRNSRPRVTAATAAPMNVLLPTFSRA